MFRGRSMRGQYHPPTTDATVQPVSSPRTTVPFSYNSLPVSMPSNNLSLQTAQQQQLSLCNHNVLNNSIQRDLLSSNKTPYADDASDCNNAHHHRRVCILYLQFQADKGFPFSYFLLSKDQILIQAFKTFIQDHC